MSSVTSNILNSYPAEVAALIKAQPAEGLSNYSATFDQFIRSTTGSSLEASDVKPLFQKYCSIVHMAPDSLEHPFVNAVLENQLDLVARFLGFKDKGFDINCSSSDGKTAAHAAAASGNTHFFDELEGLNLEARDQFGNRPLHVAVVGHHKESVAKLVEKGVELDAENDFALTPLQFANKEGFSDIAKVLTDAGATDFLD